MRPVWLLDVDGVLNALGQGLPADTYARTEAVAEGRTYPIAYQPAVVHRIACLHRDGVIEVRWLTTWCDDANRSLAKAIGMPTLEVEGVSQYRAYQRHVRPTYGWWKSKAAEEVARFDRNRIVIWTDDELDLRIRSGAVPWIGAHYNVVPLAPDSLTGLTLEQVEMIASSVTSVAAL